MTKKYMKMKKGKGMGGECHASDSQGEKNLQSKKGKNDGISPMRKELGF